MPLSSKLYCVATLLGGLLTLTSRSHAADGSLRLQSEHQLSRRSIYSSDSGAPNEVALGFQSTSFLAGQGQSGNDSLTFTGLDLNLRGEGKIPGLPIRAKGDGEILFGLNHPKYRFFEVPEAFLGAAIFGDSSELAIGRKKNLYSSLDEAWGLGLTQGQFQWDYLHPESVGLLGAHLEKSFSLGKDSQSGSLTFRGIYSPFFIPNRGSPVEFQNGRVSSVLPWAVNPPEKITLQEKAVDIRYQAEIPPLSELLKQTTFGGQIAWETASRIRVSASYLNKPMNQLLFSYEPYYRLDQDLAEVTLYPRVARHHLFSGEVSQAFSQGMLTLSGLREIPMDQPPAPTGRGISLQEFGTVQTTRTTQRVTNSTLISPSLDLYFQKNSTANGYLRLSYLKRFGEDLPDSGDQADGKTSFFDPVIRFNQAALFQLTSPPWKSFQLENRVIYDIQFPSTLISTQVSFRPKKNWMLYTEVDVLTAYGSEETNGTNERQGFISRFVNNDRFMGGVRYVF
jgi:hypothetical protein